MYVLIVHDLMKIKLKKNNNLMSVYKSYLP